jgi:hypothetical protein
MTTLQWKKHVNKLGFKTTVDYQTRLEGFGTYGASQNFIDGTYRVLFFPEVVSLGEKVTTAKEAMALCQRHYDEMQ